MHCQDKCANKRKGIKCHAKITSDGARHHRSDCKRLGQFKDLK